MIEIPGRLHAWHRFEPGEIITPADTPEHRREIENRSDLMAKYGSWDEYMFQHTWVVVGMDGNDTAVKIKRLGQTNDWTSSVSSNVYWPAKPERIAAVVARRITAEPEENWLDKLAAQYSLHRGVEESDGDLKARISTKWLRTGFSFDATGKIG